MAVVCLHVRAACGWPAPVSTGRLRRGRWAWRGAASLCKLGARARSQPLLLCCMTVLLTLMRWGCGALTFDVVAAASAHS